MGELEEEHLSYKIVVNEEEQYSIWLAYRENPLGWRNVGVTGSKPECLGYIEKAWADMRPFGRRKEMDLQAAGE